MNKTDVLGWSVVVGAIGLMGYAGYRGFESIFGKPAAAADDMIEKVEGLVKYHSESAPATDANTAKNSESEFQTQEAINMTADNPNLNAALKAFQKELSEYTQAQSDYDTGGLFRNLGLKTTLYKEYNDAKVAALKVNEVAGKEIVRVAQL